MIQNAHRHFVTSRFPSEKKFLHLMSRIRIDSFLGPTLAFELSGICWWVRDKKVLGSRKQKLDSWMDQGVMATDWLPKVFRKLKDDAPFATGISTKFYSLGSEIFESERGFLSLGQYRDI